MRVEYTRITLHNKYDLKEYLNLYTSHNVIFIIGIILYFNKRESYYNNYN